MSDRLKDATEIEEILGGRLEYPVLFSMEPRRRDIELLGKYRDAVGDFRLFMKDVYAAEGELNDWYDELDFNGVVMGFLVAKGVPPLDAYGLCSFLRYNLQYFDLDPEIKGS